MSLVSLFKQVPLFLQGTRSLQASESAMVKKRVMNNVSCFAGGGGGGGCVCV